MDFSGLVLVLKRGWPLLAIATGVALYYFLGLDRYFGIEALRANRVGLTAWVNDNGLWALAAFAVVYAVMVALSVPGAGVMTLAGGFMFGVIVATAVIVFAATAGATLLFLAARTALGKPLRARAGPWLRTLEAGFAENALSYLLLLRLMPIFPFWLVNLAPAFLHIPIRTYVFGTFFGIIPATLVYAWVGSGIGHVLDQGGEPDLHMIYSPNVLGPILALAALATVPIAYKRYRRSRERARG
ncbi:MAG: TVP38/TMEM64 family protein [Alphaproteobacteria bacterium]|nr:TVP38/TMEM64 family protein [Alphaproteobacteria bacterium]